MWQRWRTALLELWRHYRIAIAIALVLPVAKDVGEKIIWSSFHQPPSRLTSHLMLPKEPIIFETSKIEPLPATWALVARHMPQREVPPPVEVDQARTNNLLELARIEREKQLALNNTPTDTKWHGDAGVGRGGQYEDPFSMLIGGIFNGIGTTIQAPVILLQGRPAMPSKGA